MSRTITQKAFCLSHDTQQQKPLIPLKHSFNKIATIPQTHTTNQGPTRPSRPTNHTLSYLIQELHPFFSLFSQQPPWTYSSGGLSFFSRTPPRTGRVRSFHSHSSHGIKNEHKKKKSFASRGHTLHPFSFLPRSCAFVIACVSPLLLFLDSRCALTLSVLSIRVGDANGGGRRMEDENVAVEGDLSRFVLWGLSEEWWCF